MCRGVGGPVLARAPEAAADESGTPGPSSPSLLRPNCSTVLGARLGVSPSTLPAYSTFSTGVYGSPKASATPGYVTLPCTTFRPSASERSCRQASCQPFCASFTA